MTCSVTLKRNSDYGSRLRLGGERGFVIRQGVMRGNTVKMSKQAKIATSCN